VSGSRPDVLIKILQGADCKRRFFYRQMSQAACQEHSNRRACGFLPVCSLAAMNNSIRCVGLLLIVLLSACDADKPPAPAPAPTPKVAVERVPAETKGPALPLIDSGKPAAQTAPLVVEAPAAPFKQLEREPVHTLSPNIAVVPVVATQNQPASAKKPVAIKAATSATPGKSAAPEKSRAEAATVQPRAPIASKTKPAREVVQQTRLSKPSLDLSLPNDMVDQIEPAGKVAPIINRAVLPQMFSEKKSTKDTPFQLNGRLLSNELQLQRRDEEHRPVEGAALDFEFKQ
jgi:hypothetical protein